MAVNLDIAVQMLGVIVQSYASILAIGTAFYTFMIQFHKSRIDSLIEEITEESDQALQEIFQTHPSLFYESRLSFKNDVLSGRVAFSNWLNEMRASISGETGLMSAFDANSGDLMLVGDRVEDKNVQHKKSASLSLRNFILFFGVCAAVFGFSLGLLWRLSMNIAFLEIEITIAWALAVFGLFPVAWVAFQIAHAFR